MKVPYGEGVATHTGPESCGGAREGMAEALTGDCVGQVLSRERKYYFRMPTASICTEGNTVHCDIASDGLILRGLRPWACTKASRTGTGRSHTRPWKMVLGSASGIRKEYIGDERAWEVGQVHSTKEAFEQGLRLSAGCGEGGGKGPDQGESVTTKQVPDTVPGKEVRYGQP